MFVSGAAKAHELHLALPNELFDRMTADMVKEPDYILCIAPMNWVVKLWPARRTEHARAKWYEVDCKPIEGP